MVKKENCITFEWTINGEPCARERYFNHSDKYSSIKGGVMVAEYLVLVRMNGEKGIQTFCNFKEAVKRYRELYDMFGPWAVQLYKKVTVDGKTL